MANKKLYTDREAALAVLKKAHEVLAKSDLMKRETGHEKGVHTQYVSEPTGPEDEKESLRGRSIAGLSSETASSMSGVKVKDPELMSGKALKNQAVREHKRVLSEMKNIKPKLGKSENPDKESDAELGEKIEHEVEAHMEANKEAEKEEGHPSMDKHGLSPEQMKNKLNKHGLSPEQMKSKLKKCETCGDMHKSEDFEGLCKDLGALKESFDLVKGETKHDRCAREVKENSPEVKNPHAVCVAEGVRPEKWSKSEEGSKPGDYGNVKPHLSHLEMVNLPREEHHASDDKHKTGARQPGHWKLHDMHRKNAAIAAAKGDHDLADKHGKMADMHMHYSIGISQNHNKIKDAGKLHEELSKEEHLHKAEQLHNDLCKAEQYDKTKNPADKKKAKEEAPSDNVERIQDPEKNPKEKAEGNNELAGTTPTQVGQDGKNVPGFDEIRGHLKLAKFIGHMEAKRKMKAPQNG